jgi:hypothetical protein
MAAPDEILVLAGSRFSNYMLENTGSGEPRVQFLAKADSDGQLTGDWRAVMAGLCTLNYSVSAAQIYQSPQLAGKEILQLKNFFIN